jgi:hypothetical protein
MSDLQEHRLAALRTAGHLCRLGIRIFPLKYGAKEEFLHKGDWDAYATNDINKFVTLVPPGLFNMAISFGPESNICDVEPDSDSAAETLRGMIEESGVKTVMYFTSRRGIHHLFKYEPRLAVFNKANLKVDNIECRLGLFNEKNKRRQYSVIPPSLHPDTGLFYNWVPGHAPWDVDVAQMPENIIQFFLTNYANKDYSKTDVVSTGEGFLPGEGYRHDWLLKFSKELYTKWLLPRPHVEDLCRYMSQAIGSYELEGRGEHEIKNLFNNLQRPVDPLKELTAEISMEDVNDVLETMRSMQASSNAGQSPEIPTHVFPEMIEEASQYAKLAGYPRNLFLHAILCVTSHALGQAVRVRVSPDHGTMGLQMFSFGVGGSGTGKSKTLSALLGPVSHSESVTTEGSPEGLVSLMSRFQRGIMLEFTEGKEFFKMLGKYGPNAGQGSDNSLFHKCWSGDKIKRTLQKGTFGVQSPFLTVCAAIQKINLNQMPVNDCMDGLLPRMFVYPIGDVPAKEDPAALAKVQEFLRQWYEIVGRLESVKPSIGLPSISGLLAGAGVAINPLTMTLDAPAREAWREYAAYKKSPQTLSQWPEDHPYRADVVRHAEIALRTATGLFVLNCACDKGYWDQYQVGSQDHGTISKEWMQRGIDFMEHNWYQKQKLVDGIVESAFAVASSNFMLGREESVPARFAVQAADRRRRVEKAFGEVWTLREYYSVLKLKKDDARKELDMFLREGTVVELPIQDGQKTARFKFLGEADA